MKRARFLTLLLAIAFVVTALPGFVGMSQAQEYTLQLAGAYPSTGETPRALATEKIKELIPEIFSLKPALIIKNLDLLRPIYRKTAAYGHFGRAVFPWEDTSSAAELAAEAAAL